MSVKSIFSESDNVFTCKTPDQQNIIINTASLLNNLNNFYCINPVFGSRRRQSDLTRYVNFLFECDTTDIDQQFKLLDKVKNLEIVRMATYSGGKSIHFIVSCADTLELGEPGSPEATARYKQIWTELALLFTNLGIVPDLAGKNPATLSRYPGAFRDGTKQSLLFDDGPLVTSEYLQSLANTVVKPSVRYTVQSTDNFEHYMKKDLYEIHQHFAFPGWVQSGNGNYPYIFKKTLWVLDNVDVDYYEFTNYFEKYTAPWLRKKNYHKDFKLPIRHAFMKKGRL
jgi:hypothetical protein